jgi:hypothetical protein
MNTPGIEDAEKAISYGQQQKARGDSSPDPAVQGDCWRQAAQAFGNASRILAALAAAKAPPAPPGPGAVAMNFGAPGHTPAFAPGPR